MQMRVDIALKAALKSLNEVIAPAVDPQDKMAREQVALVIGLLTLVAQRLPHGFAYDLDELARLSGLAREILPACPGSSLEAAQANGADVIARARASPAEVVEAIAALRSTLGDAAAHLGARSDAAGKTAVRALLDASAAQLLRERSWVIAQGWESDPASVPVLSSLIASSRFEE